MATNLQLVLICLTSIFLIFSFAIVYVNGDCSYSSCATNLYSYPYYSKVDIFPFRTPDQPLTCGLPGFDLLCDVTSRTPLLSFPSGQSFPVDWIYKSTGEILILGARGCHPEKLLHLNFSGTPFFPKYWSTFTLYSCLSTANISYPLSSTCSEIGCVKGKHNPVVCNVRENSSSLSDYGCSLKENVMVAGSWYSAWDFSRARSVYLTWHKPRECVQCDSIGEVCRRDPRNYTHIKCFPDPRPSYPRERKDISKYIPVIVAAPIVLVIVCAYCIRCRRIQIQNRHAIGVLGNTTTRQHQANASTIAGRTHANTMSSANQGSNGALGVEEATLNTYPIILVGESGRILINIEDKTCSICLSDYEPKDILKSLPEYLHRFHSDCIDEWLRAKAMCPICRNSPPRTSNS